MSHPSNPSVWKRFNTIKNKTSDQNNFRIQDLTEEYYEAALNLFLSDFIYDEPVAKAMKIWKDPLSVKEMADLWMDVFRYRVSLACFDEESKELVGVNAVFIETGNESYDVTAENWKKIFDANIYVAKKVNIKEKYKVEQYLGAFGLVVSKKYRGCGIGTELLKARIPLCKALGLKVSSNNFSGAGSQKCAENAGFSTDVIVTYDELTNVGYKFENIAENCIKIMSLEIK